MNCKEIVRDILDEPIRIEWWSMEGNSTVFIKFIIFKGNIVGGYPIVNNLDILKSDIEYKNENLFHYSSWKDKYGDKYSLRKKYEL